MAQNRVCSNSQSNRQGGSSLRKSPNSMRAFGPADEVRSLARRTADGAMSYPTTSKPAFAHSRTPPSYRICDGLTEGYVYFAVVFAPWAFGTTERWSIWTMNIACYVLGALFMAKWLIRLRTGYQPVRGNEEKAERLLSRPAG